MKENSNGTYNITNAHGDYVFNTWGTSNMHVTADGNRPA